MNPYEILGVGRTAAAAEIKAAYRRLSKTAHPDVGGDRNAFERLRAAFDILSDPDARAHFDATGEARTKTADNAQAVAMTVLAAAFDAVVGEIVRNSTDYKQVDIVDALRRHIQGGIDRRGQERQSVERNRPYWLEMRERFTTEDGKPNLLAAVVNAKIAQIDQIGRNHDRADSAAVAALAILADHEYRVDQVDSYSFWSGHTGTAGSSSTFVFR